MSVDTKGGRYQVQWDDSAPMTPLGQLVFFAQFLHAGGRWEEFCREAPFGFTSPNAPTHENVLGSLALSILCGHTRYAHVNALRFDTVTPPGRPNPPCRFSPDAANFPWNFSPTTTSFW